MLLVYSRTGQAAGQCGKAPQILAGDAMKAGVEFARKITEELVKREIVQREDAALYQYGIENGIAIAGNLLASAIFGIVTGRLGSVLVFLLFYSTLRSFGGGVHCKSKAGCFCLSLLILLIPAYSGKWVMAAVSKPALIMAGIIAVVIILVLSPVESVNKPLDDEERKYYRRISQCITALQICALVFLFTMDRMDYFYAGYSSIILIAVFMVIGKISAKHYI